MRRAHPPFIAPIFAELEERASALMSPDLLRRVILYHYRQGLQQKLLDYKLNHQEKSFDDLLRLFCEALQGPQGNELAEMIRFQYPFAMIDEFQDTDSQQYAIFSKIYRDNPEKNTGFIMIGDPKQAIYRFRGADIFTYLKHRMKPNLALNSLKIIVQRRIWLMASMRCLIFLNRHLFIKILTLLLLILVMIICDFI